MTRTFRSICPTRVGEEGKQKMVERFREEYDWFSADLGRDRLAVLLYEITQNMYKAGVVVSPGYSFLADSFLLRFFRVHMIDGDLWDLPFERFKTAIDGGSPVVLETGSGGVEAARKALNDWNGILVAESEPGFFNLTFLDGILLPQIEIQITTFSALDTFSQSHILRYGWTDLTPAILQQFNRAETDGTIWFESDKIREWLFEFDPESMSDLVLLNALFFPQLCGNYPEILHRKQHPESISSTGNAAADAILSESYGILVYQEQALQLQKIGYPVDKPMKELALKGHMIGRTMMSVEAIAQRNRRGSRK